MSIISPAFAGLAPRFSLGKSRMKLHRMSSDEVKKGSATELIAWVSDNPHNYWRFSNKSTWFGSSMILDELSTLEVINA